MSLEISQYSQENTCTRPANLLKKRLSHRYFPMNFSKLLRTPFLTEHIRWLLLYVEKYFLGNLHIWFIICATSLQKIFVIVSHVLRDTLSTSRLILLRKPALVARISKSSCYFSLLICHKQDSTISKNFKLTGSIYARRFYMTGDMVSLSKFIQGLLEKPTKQVVKLASFTSCGLQSFRKQNR